MPNFVKRLAAVEPKTGLEGVGRYFTHSRENNNNHPLVDMIEGPRGRGRLLNGPIAIGPDVAPFRFAFAAPVPRRPLMADHHKEPRPLVSSKIKEAVEQMVERSVEFVPAQIETPGEIFPYWAIHCLKGHDVFDRVNSSFRSTLLGSIKWVEKLFIDYEKLAKIDKEERMLFALEGSAVIWLWHEEVVKAIEATQATGIRFFPADGYGQDAIFTP